jgi:hypothetical protein
MTGGLSRFADARSGTDFASVWNHERIRHICQADGGMFEHGRFADDAADA